MPQDNIKSFETESFKAGLEKLAKSGAVGDAAFADAVYTALSRYGVDEEKFRDTFGMTKGAVERWTQRQNLPQPSIRPKILDWIRAQI